MRPIRLKLAGLHSYREMQEVDFETLCEAGLFGIFGPTGSGKSTILDAITLALYGQVVRLGGGTHPKDVLNQLEQRVFVSFTFEIGRAEERRRYTIEREFGIDKKGNRRQPEVRLIQCGSAPGEADVVLESKASGATAAIESLIGLTLQDFTRAVVLPQGQFSRFLTLKGSERNEMLQRMFGLHIYGEKLNERVRAALEQVKAEMHRLQLELAALGDVGPQALLEARSALESAIGQEQAYSQQKQALQQQMEEMKQVYLWQKEHAAVQERISLLAARQEEMAELSERIRELEASLVLWPLKQKWQQIDAEWSATAEVLKQQREEQESAAAAHEAAEQSYQERQAQLRMDEPLLIEQKSGLVQAIEWEKELEALKAELSAVQQELLSVAGELEQVTKRLKQDEEQLEVLERESTLLSEQMQAATVTPEMRRQIAEAREAKRNWEREQAKQLELEQELSQVLKERQALLAEAERLKIVWQESAQAHEQAKQKLAEYETKPLLSEADVEKRRETLAQVKQLGKEWREQLALETTRQEKWMQWEREWQQAEARTASLETAWKAEEAKRDEQRLALEAVRHAWNDWQQANMARVLRGTLVDGEECPVCGSTHHPRQTAASDSDSEHEKAGEQLRKEAKAAEEALQAAERQVQAALELLQAAKLEQAALVQRKNVLEEEREAIHRRVEEIRQECGNLGSDWEAAEIGQLLEAYQRADGHLRMQLEERERAKAALEQLQQQCSQLREREIEQKSLYERQAILLEQREEKLTELNVRLKTAQEQTKLAEEALHKLRGELRVDEIEARYEAIGELDRKLEQLQHARAEREARKKQFLAGWEAAKAKRTELLLRQETLRERKEEKKRLFEQRYRLWLERTGGEPANQRMIAVEEALAKLRAAVQEAEEQRKQTLAVRQQVQEALVKNSEAYAGLTRQRADAEAALQEAMMQSGIGSAERIDQLYGERDRLPAYRKQVTEYEEALKQARYDEQRLSQALAGRSVSEEQWSAAMQTWDELEQTFQVVKDQVAVARQTLTRIESNHEKWQQLQERLAEQSDEQSRLEELKKLFEGKAFVQFIAEEKLASIARDASYHLRRMTKNRYALEIGDEGEFVLRDEGAGGMRRPVGTLSGGETFLTSLSLALALSVEIQMRGGRLEFFFLDEGFGTLDPDLLEVVLDALERLRMSDFTIGVISHVPEMRVRMPRRLVVTPAEPLGAGSRIQLEME
jgi:exonuclease SbcC